MPSGKVNISGGGKRVEDKQCISDDYLSRLSEDMDTTTLGNDQYPRCANRRC